MLRSHTKKSGKSSTRVKQLRHSSHGANAKQYNTSSLTSVGGVRKIQTSSRVSPSASFSRRVSTPSSQPKSTTRGVASRRTFARHHSTSETNNTPPTAVQEWLNLKPTPKGMYGTLDNSLLFNLGATLNTRTDSSSWLYNTKNGAHPAYLWITAPYSLPTKDLSPDGYNDHVLPPPPDPFTARMWGGGEISWYKPLYLGNNVLHSESVLDKPLFKKGKSGGFIVATATSTWSPPDNREDVFCEEKVNYIFRDKNTRIAKHTPDLNKKQPVLDVDYSFERAPMELDEALLFRFSALTWNTHKIHYNKEYAHKEGYQDILVHGPLQATLALDLLGDISQRLAPQEPPQMKQVYQLVNAFQKQDQLKQWTKHHNEHHHHHEGEHCEPPQFDDIPNPEWHQRFQSLRHFAYKINYPLVANTKVRVLGKIVQDEMDFAEYNARVSSATASSLGDFVKPLTLQELTRNKPAYVQVWIQDASDPSLVYFNSTAVFDAPLDLTYYDVPERALNRLLEDIHQHQSEM